jgi:signal transduction histidine kinase
VLKSLQARLIAASVAVLVLCGILAGLGSYRAATIEADEILDAHLAQLAQTLLFLSQADRGRSAGDIGVGERSEHGHSIFQVWQLKAEPIVALVGNSTAMRDTRPFPRLILRSGDMDTHLFYNRNDGYSHAESGANSFRVFGQTSADGAFRVIVGQDLLDRREMVQGIARSNMEPYLLILPFGLTALIGLIYRSLGPIRRLTAEVASRQPNHMAPLAVGDTPNELLPLTLALNTLLERLSNAIINERRFTGDAAHELRTPMAALCAQLDALRLANNKETRIQAQHQAAATAERLVRLVNQLLTLARLDTANNPPKRLADLAELAREYCMEIGPGAIQKGIDLSLHAIPTRLRGEDEAFRILLRNLVDNALRYTPAGGRVEVSVSQTDGLARLIVADNGPGVPAEQLGALGQRFNRLGQLDGAGVGLGLSIVMRIVERHRGRIHFGTGLDCRGLAVTVELPGVGLLT